MDPKELTEFLSQKPFEEPARDDDEGLGTGVARPVVIVDVKVPFSSLAILLLKLTLAALPFLAVLGLAGYLALKWLPKLIS